MKQVAAFLLSSILYVSSVQAQCFQTTLTNVGNSIIFKIRPMGGDITTGFSAMEFFLRYPESNVLTWGTVVPNTTQFPGLQISKETPSLIATEAGSTIVRFFQTLLTTTTSVTYTNGTEYEVFRITASGTGTVNLELLHLDTYLKYWSTMTALDAITERTCDVKFYGIGATATAASFQNFFLNNVIIPIDMVSFNGKDDVTDIKLSWKTASERAVSHFVVEKSSDNDKAFTSIGEVKAVGNSGTPQYYSLVDAQPNLLNYYRLKTMDMDGTSAYSKVITIERTNKDKAGIRLYPNPAHDVLNIQFNDKNMTATIQLFDITGRIVLTERIKDNASLNIQSLQSGLYTAVILTNGHKTMHKVVITK